MKTIYNQLVPFNVNICYSQNNNKETMSITLIMQHKYSYIYLINVRPVMGRVAEHTKYLYDGKPLWCIKAIKGHVYFDDSIYQKILDTLNVRPLLPDVKVTIYSQFTKLPIDIRSHIINLLELPGPTPKQRIYDLFITEYHKQYHNLLSTFSLFEECHPYIQDFKMASKMFTHEVKNEEIATRYLDKTSVDFFFHHEFTYINNNRHHTHIVADVFKLYENECRLNKTQWYKYIKIHLNMFFIIQSIINTEYTQTLEFTQNNIFVLADTWVHFLRRSGFSQSGKLQHL